MLAPIEIPFPGIHPRIGMQALTVDPGTYSFGPSARFAREPYAVLMYWARSLGGWLHVNADSGGGTGNRFGNAPDDLVATIGRHKAQATQMAREVATDAWIHAHHFLVGSATPPAALGLRLAVNTGHELFVKYVGEDAPPHGVALAMTLVYFHANLQPESQELRILLQPATPVRVSPALLALDLGNTSSSAAIFDPYNRPADPRSRISNRIPMLTTRPIPGRGGAIGYSDPRGASLASEIRFDQFRTWLRPGDGDVVARTFPDFVAHPDDDRLNAVDWMVGDMARSTGTPARSVVIGAKRMASARPLPRKPGDPGPRYATHPVSATHKMIPDGYAGETQEVKTATIQLDVRAPLELLACRLLQHFREDRRAWPERMALTYPTTYSRFELLALRRAVQKGWLRMQARRQNADADAPAADPDLNRVVRDLQRVVNGPIDLDTQAEDPVIQLLVDEASAAAFFHLYRRIFEELDGGLAGFRYVYPTGLNMLLYDCGGGTTDIALVKASVESDTRTLRITVLRRSGVMTFGGDDITRQACRLLKAKLAFQIAIERKKGSLPALPEIPAKSPSDDGKWQGLAANLERFIDEMARFDPQDELVPTKTLPNQQPTEDRRSAALALWSWGETLKHRLSEETAGTGAGLGLGTPTDVRLPPFDRETNAIARAILIGDPAQIAALKRRFETVSLSRIELDALIFEPLRRSIRNCNRLIRDVFETNIDALPEEVHWVVASGNAVRYPFLQEMLKRRLAVAFLDDGRFTFDRANAKDATAKGAVLALAAMEARGEQIDPRFDSDLANLLPFDVGYRNLSVNGVKVLFAEHTHYRVLKTREPVQVPLVEVAAGGVAAKRFELLRRFPGDEQFELYLAFEFPEGMRGQFVSIAYDDSSEFEFRVADGVGSEGLPVDPSAGDLYRAPALRGDL
jgi:molecular chaperone DnaK (HSP70)